MVSKVVAWVAEGTWPACVDAVRAWAPADAEVLLVHVAGGDLAAAQGALAGLLGRGRPSRGSDLDALAESTAAELLEDAVDRLGRPAETRHLSGGRTERLVVEAADGADLLVVARDGDRNRLGPRSIGRDLRFVVDHAPCPVLLVWPESAPEIGSIPPPPPPGHEPPPLPHEREPPPPPYEPRRR
jgi:nucleotide-binding universal stress UspA family protein